MLTAVGCFLVQLVNVVSCLCFGRAKARVHGRRVRYRHHRHPYVHSVNVFGSGQLVYVSDVWLTCSVGYTLQPLSFFGKYSTHVASGFVLGRFGFSDKLAQPCHDVLVL